MSYRQVKINIIKLKITEVTLHFVKIQNPELIQH